MKLDFLIDSLDSCYNCALVSSCKNIFYFTGLKVSYGYLLITRSTKYLFVDFRYIEVAKKCVVNCEVVLINNVLEQINIVLKKHGCKNVCVESHELSVHQFNNLKDKLNVEIICNNDLSDLISNMRQVKTKEELNNIKIAQHFSDEAFIYILQNMKVGITEKEIALNLEFFTRKLGSENASFDFIVASGPNSSLPHAVPSDRKIEEGDFVLLDFGCTYNSYKSDMSRTIGIGKISERQKNVYDIVLNAQKNAISLIKENALCCDVDKAARETIYNAGYKGCFGHSLGHSLGLDIHESPTFSHNCKTRLKKDMIMTVEPGIYIQGEFGVRIEDTVIVCETGCENITLSEKNLVII